MRGPLEKASGILIPILMLWGEFGGIYHTYTKHRDQLILAIFMPPVSWYRSIEFFWHKDFSVKNWEKTQRDDARSIIYLLNSSTNEEVNREKLNQEIDLFSQRISKYPENKKTILKTIANDYIQYQENLFKDFLETLKSLSASGNITQSRSDKTVELETRLESYGLKNYTEMTNKALDLLYKEFTINLNKPDQDSRKTQENLQLFESYLPAYTDAKLTPMREAYERIFD